MENCSSEKFFKIDEYKERQRNDTNASKRALIEEKFNRSIRALFKQTSFTNSFSLTGLNIYLLSLKINKTVHTISKVTSFKISLTSSQIEVYQDT